MRLWRRVYSEITNSPPRFPGVISRVHFRVSGDELLTGPWFTPGSFVTLNDGDPELTETRTGTWKTCGCTLWPTPRATFVSVNGISSKCLGHPEVIGIVFGALVPLGTSVVLDTNFDRHVLLKFFASVSRPSRRWMPGALPIENPMTLSTNSCRMR